MARYTSKDTLTAQRGETYGDLIDENCDMVLLVEVFASVLTDEFFTIPTTEAKECLKGAQQMIQQLSQPTQLHVEFSKWLVLGLKSLVDGASKPQGINREKLWSSFHQKTSSDNFTSHWKEFTSAIGVNLTPLLYQHVTDEIFNRLIKKSFGLHQDKDKQDEKSVLSSEHENAVHYVGGYILHKMKIDPNNQELLPLLEKLICTDSSNHTGTSHEWTKFIDRGGLTDITDEAYQCFYEIEVVCRQFLKLDRTREMNPDFMKRVTEAILNDDDVLFSWCLAAGIDFSEDITNRCLKLMTKKWLSIRGNSFAANTLEMYKQYSKKGTDKSKPLRSKLFTEDM